MCIHFFLKKIVHKYIQGIRFHRFKLYNGKCYFQLIVSNLVDMIDNADFRL